MEYALEPNRLIELQMEGAGAEGAEQQHRGGDPLPGHRRVRRKPHSHGATPLPGDSRGERSVVRRARLPDPGRS